MRKIRENQLRLMPSWVDHPHAKELEAMSRLLEGNPDIAMLAMKDLADEETAASGAPGMTADQVVRVAVLKQLNRFSYDELAFHLQDSACYRAFVGLGWGEAAPRRATLAENVRRLTGATWEAINRVLVDGAREDGIERGDKLRIDGTVVETNILAPADSDLLWDTVRVLTRWLSRAETASLGVRCPRIARKAKSRSFLIKFTRGKEKRLAPYRELIALAERTINASECAREVLAARDERFAARVVAKLDHYLPLGRRVVDQAKRRILEGETVPSQQKLVSIFEPHSEVIIKGRRAVQFGRKVTFTVGASALVTDCVIEKHTPCDADIMPKMLERARTQNGRAPRQVALDGGYASKANLAHAKALGVEDVCFSKRVGLELTDMVRSAWVYKRLWRFRAGIEGCISFLKRGFGLDRCTWKGEAAYGSYVWASICTYNLLLLARHELAR